MTRVRLRGWRLEQPTGPIPLGEITTMSQQKRISELQAALELAQAHIGWCWDIIEERTRLRREGSATVLNQLRDAIEGKPRRES